MRKSTQLTKRKQPGLVNSGGVGTSHYQHKSEYMRKKKFLRIEGTNSKKFHISATLLCVPISILQVRNTQLILKIINFPFSLPTKLIEPTHNHSRNPLSCLDYLHRRHCIRHIVALQIVIDTPRVNGQHKERHEHKKTLGRLYP